MIIAFISYAYSIILNCFMPVTVVPGLEIWRVKIKGIEYGIAFPVIILYGEGIPGLHHMHIR